MNVDDLFSVETSRRQRRRRQGRSATSTPISAVVRPPWSCPLCAATPVGLACTDRPFGGLRPRDRSRPRVFVQLDAETGRMDLLVTLWGRSRLRRNRLTMLRADHRPYPAAPPRVVQNVRLPCPAGRPCRPSSYVKPSAAPRHPPGCRLLACPCLRRRCRAWPGPKGNRGLTVPPCTTEP